MPCFRCKPTCQKCGPKPGLKAIRLCPECGWYNMVEDQICKKCGVVLSPMSENEVAKQLAPKIPMAQCALCSPLDNPRCDHCIHMTKVECPQCGTLNIAGKIQCRKCDAGLPTDLDKYAF